MQTQGINQYFEGRGEAAELDPKVAEELRLEIQNHRLALMQANNYGARISEEVLRVGEFTGDRIAEALDGVITIDKVGFKDPEELLYVYMHEGLHGRGIRNEAIVQLMIRKYGPESAKAKAREDYAEEQLTVGEVARRIGTNKMIELYEGGDFTKMYTLFKYVCMEEENMDEGEVAQIFFKAFPELEFKETLN